MRSIFLNDTGGNKFSRKESVLYALSTCFFITLYLKGMPVVNNIVIGLLVLYCFSVNSVREKLVLLRQRPAVLLMAVFYLLNILSALLSKNIPEGFSWVQIRVPLLLFPISMGLICISDVLKDRILSLYIRCTLVAAIICMVWAMYTYTKTGDAGYLYNDSLSYAIGKQSIYFALMISIALFSQLYLLFNNSILVKNKLHAIITVLILVVIHFMLASRAAIIILYTGSIIFSCYYFFNIRKVNLAKGAAAFAAFILIIAGMAFLFPKTIQRFKEMKYTSYTFNSHGAESHYNMQLTPEQWNGSNTRRAIWACGWQLAREHFLWGVSLGDKHKALLDVYRTKHFDFGVQTNKNMHNTYLDVLSSMGVIALAIFVAGFFILSSILCFSNHDVLGLLIISAFALSLVTETYIDQSIGSVLLSFFLSFTISYQKPALPLNQPA